MPEKPLGVAIAEATKGLETFKNALIKFGLDSGAISSELRGAFLETIRTALENIATLRTTNILSSQYLEKLNEVSSSLSTLRNIISTNEGLHKKYSNTMLALDLEMKKLVKTVKTLQESHMTGAQFANLLVEQFMRIVPGSREVITAFRRAGADIMKFGEVARGAGAGGGFLPVIGQGVIVLASLYELWRRVSSVWDKISDQLRETRDLTTVTGEAINASGRTLAMMRLGIDSQIRLMTQGVLTFNDVKNLVSEWKTKGGFYEIEFSGRTMADMATKLGEVQQRVRAGELSPAELARVTQEYNETLVKTTAQLFRLQQVTGMQMEVARQFIVDLSRLALTGSRDFQTLYNQTLTVANIFRTAGDIDVPMFMRNLVEAQKSARWLGLSTEETAALMGTYAETIRRQIMTTDQLLSVVQGYMTPNLSTLGKMFILLQTNMEQLPPAARSFMQRITESGDALQAMTRLSMVFADPSQLPATMRREFERMGITKEIQLSMMQSINNLPFLQAKMVAGELGPSFTGLLAASEYATMTGARSWAGAYAHMQRFTDVGNLSAQIQSRVSEAEARAIQQRDTIIEHFKELQKLQSQQLAILEKIAGEIVTARSPVPGSMFTTPTLSYLAETKTELVSGVGK